MGILTGESLLNDAMALTLFTLAVASITGQHTLSDNLGLLFLYGAAVGIVIGLVLGWLVNQVRSRLGDPVVESVLILCRSPRLSPPSTSRRPEWSRSSPPASSSAPIGEALLVLGCGIRIASTLVRAADPVQALWHRSRGVTSDGGRIPAHSDRCARRGADHCGRVVRDARRGDGGGRGRCARTLGNQRSSLCLHHCREGGRDRLVVRPHRPGHRPAVELAGRRSARRRDQARGTGGPGSGPGRRRGPAGTALTAKLIW